LAGKLSLYVTTIQVNSALHPFRVAKSSISFDWRKGEKVTSARQQVTLCDPTWYVMSRSGEVVSQTAMRYFTFAFLNCKTITKIDES